MVSSKLSQVNSNNQILPFKELVEKWIDILAKLKSEGTTSVTIGELKPFINKSML